jgi:hypothetical protein
MAPLFAGVALVAASLSVAGPASAAAPAGTLSVPATPATHSVTYAGHAPFNNDQDFLVYGQLGLDDPKNACSTSNTTLNDQHTVTLSVPASIDPKYDTLVRFQIDWTPLVNEPTADMALYVYGPDGKLISASDGSQNSEGVNITLPKAGTYTAVVCAFQDPPQGQDYTGTVTATTLLPSPFPAASGVTAPAYKQFETPAHSPDNAGEPSIGSNWKSGATLFTSNTDEYVVAFNDAAGTSTWKVVNTKVTDTTNNTISFDPIGFTDSATGRTFVSQLYLACSGAGFSDDDFANTTISQGCGSGVNGADHQTFGGGPFPTGIAPTGSYPHAVYYCSQSQALILGAATCARSDDGGQTFGAPVQAYNGACSGLHGHIRVAPDGTAYLPNAACGGHQGAVVSTDGGQTWTVRTVPDSTAGSSDPSVSAGSDGTVYLGYADGTGEPRIAVSRDRGAHWSPSIDAGLPFATHNTEFAEVIAGDGDRAAFAFLGTPTRGSNQPDGFGKSPGGKTYTGGEWHLYVATTYDRGAHWTVVDGTPHDPVQRGCIWNGGGSNPCRNLLDFNDITVDKQGRVMVGYADGCIKDTVTTGGLISQTTGTTQSVTVDCPASTDVSQNGLNQKQAILRQQSGKGLFAAYDGVLPGSRTVVKKPAKKPAKQPVKEPATRQPTGVTAPRGSLAATGNSPWLATAGALLLLLGVLPSRVIRPVLRRATTARGGRGPR